jgi:hypothetical protein
MSLLRIQVRPKMKAQLLNIVNPDSANQPEVVPWIFYDTQSVATATSGSVQFFSQVQSDKTLGNIEQPSTLADPQFFEITAFGIDYIAAPTVDASGVAGATADLANFLYTSRATFEFSLNSKLYLRVPATFLTNGGAIALSSTGTPAATSTLSSASIGTPGLGGFNVNQAIVISPKQNFTAQLTLGAATTFAATRQFRLWMAGALYRRVL